MNNRRRLKGQGTVEFALAVPMLILLLLGTVDLARAFYRDIEGAGASRAGARVGITGESADIGDFVRTEPNSGIPNTIAAWGATGAGQANANCTSAPASQKCGDPTGCPPTAFAAGQQVCFAIRTCTLSAGDVGTCASFGPWGSRPQVANPGVDGLHVLVVYRLPMVTPFIGAWVGNNGSFYLSNSSYGNALYVR